MGTERKKVLMLIPNLDFGGAQRSFALLSMALSSFVEVVPVVFNKDGINYDNKLGGELLSLDVFPSQSFLSKGLSFFRRVKRFGRLRQQLNPICTISFLEGADYVSLLARRKGKIVLSIRGSKFHDQNIVGVLGWIRLHILIPWLYRSADKVVTVTDGIRLELIKMVSDNKLVVINNWYDFNDIKRKSVEPVDPDLRSIIKHNYIVAVGRLSPEKGFIHLLEVFSKTVRVHTDLKIVFVGDGKQSVDLVSQCEHLGLRYNASRIGFDAVHHDPQVIFTGYCSNPYPIVQNAVIMALTSSAEGFPSVLIEAMSLEVPVISTDCPYGPKEILNNAGISRTTGEILISNCGILAPMFNERNCIDTWDYGLSILLEDVELRERISIRAKKIALQYTENIILKKWLSVIDLQNVN